MEQALVFASIVLGFGLASELENLNRLLRSKNVCWHWSQAGFAVFVLLTLMAYWWMIAGAERDEISLGQFLPIMWGLIILNLLCAVSLPDHVPEEGLQLAEYYLENRRYQWGLFALFVAPLSANWLVVLYLRSGSIWYTVTTGLLELIPLAAAIMLMFVRKWWLIAIGYAFLSTLILAWLSRTL